MYLMKIVDALVVVVGVVMGDWDVEALVVVADVVTKVMEDV